MRWNIHRKGGVSGRPVRHGGVVPGAGDLSGTGIGEAAIDRKMPAVFPHLRLHLAMTLAHWLVFCGASVLMCSTPGPAVLLAISAGQSLDPDGPI